MGAALSFLPATYSTSKQVVLLDRKLGILYAACILLVLGYVIGIRVLIGQAYNAVEKSYGVVGVQLSGTTYSLRNGETIPQDVASLVQFEEVLDPFSWTLTKGEKGKLVWLARACVCAGVRVRVCVFSR